MIDRRLKYQYTLRAWHVSPGYHEMSRRYFQNEALIAIAVQFLVVLILLPLLGLKWGGQAMLSFFSGGMICVLPNIYLYRRVFSHFGAQAAKRIFKSLYLGEFVKVLITGAGFAGALSNEWILPSWLFIGYIAAQLGFWLAPIATGLYKSRRMKTTFIVANHIG